MLDAQTAGSLTVIGSFAASEGAARLLDACPAWEVAWYLNLEFFRPFELARAAVTPLEIFFRPGALYLEIALIGVILLVRFFRFRFGVAFCANISFGIAAALTHAWLWSAAAPKTASLSQIGARPLPEGLLVGTLLAASFVAFVVSHLSFLIAARMAPSARAAPEA